MDAKMAALPIVNSFENQSSAIENPLDRQNNEPNAMHAKPRRQYIDVCVYTHKFIIKYIHI